MRNHSEIELKELQEILRLHKLWLKNEDEGKRANLSGANLRGANLRDADLRGANLRGADLSDANLRDANLSDANLRDANLRDADLRGADLRDADLSDANLRGANLRDADLRGANLSDANLRGANLRDADLRGADLRDANLRGANLRDADLRGVKEDFFKVLSQAANELPFLEMAITEGKINGSTYEGECACLCGTIEKTGNNTIARDASRPIERFFLGIRAGDTPENNPISRIVYEWIKEFKQENSIDCKEGI